MARRTVDKRLVRVEWIDSQDHPDKWVDEGDAAEFGNISCTVVSVGFLVSKTEKYVTLGGDWDEADKDFGRVTKIATVGVISLEDLVVSPSP